MIDSGTIAALSTPKGRGGIAVIRISGEKTKNILGKLVEKYPSEPVHRKAFHSFILNEGKREEECLVVFFKSPHSYTGEDLAEISIHSNPFLVEKVLGMIIKEDARGALPGEFTYRAFKNGKMDLIQAESVNELINANSGYYAEMKFGNLDGKLSAFLNEIKKNIVNLGVRVESIIEFEEDQYLDKIEFGTDLEESILKLEKVLKNHRFNELLNKGLNIVITGKTNVGKSSLFNILLMEERSIISSSPGTTRDFIKEKIYVDNCPVDITDIAGINSESSDKIERIGIERSLGLLENSDAVIFVLDGIEGVNSHDEKIYDLIKNKKKLIVINKIDKAEKSVVEKIKTFFNEKEICEISALKNKNIEEIYNFISGILKGLKSNSTGLSVNLRQKGLLEELMEKLKKVRTMSASISGNYELLAEEVRSVLDCIGKLMGEITEEDILNRIFSDFCIGK
ncbi:MAG: tRNA uridine-5-carboxymethylaminomethyl(34) synthesis GTPase MnmE [Acidobacteriota bacterium]